MDTQSNVKVENDDLRSEDTQHPTMQPATKVLSDGSREESLSPTYRHRWTVEQRLTLMMLAESYDNDWHELTSVFNQCYKSDLQHCGGLRSAVVYTQWRDMRKYFDAAASLRKLQAAMSPYDRSQLISPTELERKAYDIGVQLNAKGPTDSSQRIRMSGKHDAPGRKRKRADLIDDAATDFLSHRSDSESQKGFSLHTVHGPTLITKTPTKSNCKPDNPGLLTPPDSRERKKPRLTANKRLAQLGFRAFTAQSQGTYSSTLGIRAGAFLNCPTIPLARSLDVTTYQKEALHHTTKHDHSRPSMFVSATKNPMRALHMALRGGKDATIAVIDLHQADVNDSVQKVHHLKLRTEFRYTGAGEYLIFGGVPPKAIIAHLPLSRLLTNMPTTPQSDDPFSCQVLQAHEKLSHARRAIKKAVLPMTYALGRAVGELVGNFCIPPKLFQSGVWSLVSDYKYYSAEGGRRRGHWADNLAFESGAVQGYQANRSGALASLGIEDSIKVAPEIIEIQDDSGSDSDSSSSDENGPSSVEVKDWVRKLQANQASLKYFDPDIGKWTTQVEDLTDDFLAELGYMAHNVNANGPEMDGDKMGEDTMGVPGADRQDEAGNMVSDGPEMDTDAVIEAGLAVLSRNPPEEFENLHQLCADVMNMHRDETSKSELATNEVEMDYGFCWTGM